MPFVIDDSSEVKKDVSFLKTVGKLEVKFLAKVFVEKKGEVPARFFIMLIFSRNVLWIKMVQVPPANRLCVKMCVCVRQSVCENVRVWETESVCMCVLAKEGVREHTKEISTLYLELLIVSKNKAPVQRKNRARELSFSFRDGLLCLCVCIKYREKVLYLQNHCFAMW